MLYLIDVLAVVFFVIGFHLAFRQAQLLRWRARLFAPRQAPPDAEPGALSEDPEGVAAVLRMAGVMIMAFSFTSAAFANLLVHFAASSPN